MPTHDGKDRLTTSEKLCIIVGVLTGIVFTLVMEMAAAPWLNTLVIK